MRKITSALPTEMNHEQNKPKRLDKKYPPKAKTLIVGNDQKSKCRIEPSQTPAHAAAKSPKAVINTQPIPAKMRNSIENTDFATRMVIERFSQHVEIVKRDVREVQDRNGYLREPQSPAESRLWEAEASWPKE